MQQIADRYLNEIQVSELTGIALGTLRNHRFLDRGIPYVKIGRSVRYALPDIINFMERHKVHPFGSNEGRCV